MIPELQKVHKRVIWGLRVLCHDILQDSLDLNKGDLHTVIECSTKEGAKPVTRVAKKAKNLIVSLKRELLKEVCSPSLDDRRELGFKPYKKGL